MTLLRRHRYFITGLLIYWLALFAGTHVRTLPDWLVPITMSDKALHYLAYLVLVFFWWVAVSPYNKVNWKKPKVWLTLAVMVWYGTIDEWLQAYVGRQPDVYDFIANLAGAISGLVMLSIFTFWQVLLIVSAIMIFAITNLTNSNMIGPNNLTHNTFYFLAYAGYTLIWIHYLHRHMLIEKTIFLKIFTAALLPTCLLVGVNLCTILFGKQVWLTDLIGAFISIAIVVVASLVICGRGKVLNEPEAIS